MTTEKHHLVDPGETVGPGIHVECGGCRRHIDQASGGVVVAFGKSLWHVDCFRCSKCKAQVTADTNLLLLSDGDPVCSSCSYQCYVCKKPITEEAIMTGDESYHADCFTCRQCARRIEELVFAKTSQGIYCMACHNERVARSRRHAEAKQRAKAKKEREKEREREREKDKATVTPGEVEKDRRVETEKPHDKPQDKSQDVVDKPPDKRQVDTDKPLPVPSPTLSSMSTPGELTTTSRSRLSPGPVGPRQRPPVDHSLSASRNRSTGSRSTTPTTPRMGEDNDHHGKPAERSTTGDIDIDYYAGEPAVPPVHQTPHVHPQATGAIHNGPVTQPLNDTLGKKPRSPSPLPHSPLWPSSSTSSSSHHPTSTTVSQNGDHADNDDDTIKEKTVYKLPPPQTHSSQQPQKPSHDDAPYLTAPSLSTIGFSLSDPDFAKLLAENKASPEKTRQALAARAAAAAAASATSTTSHENQTSSPTKLSSKHQLSPSCLSEPNGSSNPSVPHSPLPAPSAATMQQATIVTPKNPSVRPTRSDSLKSLDKPHPNLPVAEPPSPPLHVDSTLSALLAIQSSQLDNNAVSIPRGLLDRTITELQTLHASITELKSKYSGAHRTSLHYMQGMNVAAEEYEKAVQQRTEAENQVARLKTQLHGQTARMSLIKEDEQRQETLKRQSNDLATSLSGLERDVTRLRVERDIALVEVEQLTAAREASSDTQTQATLTRSLAHRLETIKDEYTSRLGPLETQRQQITRDLAELRDTRNLYIEEATALSAKNEQLAELNVRLVKQTEAMQEGLAAAAATAANSNNNHFNARPPRASSAYLRPGLNRYHPQHISGSPSMSSIATTTSSTLHEGIVSGGSESTAGLNNVNQSSSNTNTTNAPSSSGPRRFKWYKSSKGSSTTGEPSALAHSIISRPLAVPTTQGGASAASSSTAASSTTDLQARLSNDSHLPLSSATHNNGNTIHNNNNNAQEHVFHPTSILRFSKCEHCGDKMWGLQEVRCAVCGVYCHTKCMDKLAAGGGPSAQCLGSSVASHLTRDPAGGVPGAADLSSLSPLMSSTGPSLIGRDLAEQARRDGQPVPVIVTKCIDAVETQGMEYEGIYRKTGGSSLSKTITQLFERGDYDAFDLNDIDRFNDINSITSVLKSYLRALPNPLLTHELHEPFVAAASIREPEPKFEALAKLINQLPREHYVTLRTLMLHLHRVKSSSAENLMNARNLGVVFGPTLMRSADPSREFADMAGKALSIEWMIENAPAVFL